MSGADFEDAALERVRSLGPDINTDTFAAAFNLFRASTQLIQDLETRVHRPRGLSVAGFRILFTIWTLGEMEPRTLASLSGVSRAAVSGVVTTLESAGLVEKQRQEADRRRLTVQLTPSGRSILEDAYRAQNLREQELFANLSTEDLRIFARIMRSLVDQDNR